MRFTDIVSNMDLDVYPIIALILFLVAFGLIVWAVLKTPKSFNDYQAHLPLEDDSVIPSGAHSDSKGITHG